VILSSWYICADTVWKPIAGPPARISRFTPVYSPSDISGPVTALVLASIVYLSLIIS